MKSKKLILISTLLLSGCNYYATRFWNGYYSLQNATEDFDKEKKAFYSKEPIGKKY